MATAWNKDNVDIEGSDVHRLIVESRFHRIYTTNFDHWIEAAHDAYGKAYIKIANVQDMTVATDNVRQIVKFHGDLDGSGPIVLDEASYFERLSFESPLDIKLRADLLGNSVLFVGYSISDTNIRLLFYKLAKMWSGTQRSAIKRRSFWFSPAANPVAQTVLDQWGISMVHSGGDDPGEALLRFLRELIQAE